MRRADIGRRMRWLAVAAGFLLVPTLSMPVVSAASSDTELRQVESVNVNLTPNGGLTDVVDNQYLRVTGSGDAKVVVPARLTDVKAGPGADGLKADKNQILLSTSVENKSKPQDIYFSGKADIADAGSGLIRIPSGYRQLPAKIELKYTFNGNEVTDLNDIKGRGGEFGMTAKISNLTGQAEAINYPSSTSGATVTDVGFSFVPLSGSIGPVQINNADWQNVTIDSKNMVVQGKGAETYLTGGFVLFPPTQPGSAEFKWHGLTRNFQVNSIRLAMQPGLYANQAQAVVDEQTKGGGGTKILFDALGQFLGGFEALTSQTAGLPYAANGLQRLIDEGLFKLKNQSQQQGNDLKTSLNPKLRQYRDGLVKLSNGITTLRSKIQGDGSGTGLVDGLPKLLSGVNTVAGGATQAVGNLGLSNYPGNVCATDAAANCGTTSPPTGASKLPQLPPNTALNTTTGTAVNPYGPAAAPGLVTRSQAGQIGSDLAPLSQGNTGATTSLYNLGAMATFSVQGATDANNDGVSDYPQFTYNDSTTPGATGALSNLIGGTILDAVAVRAGQLYPGNGKVQGSSTILPGANPNFPPPNALFAKLCSVNNPLDPSPTPGKLMNCATYPMQDVTVGDLLTGNAAAKIGSADLPSFGRSLDFGATFFQGSNNGVYNQSFYNCIPTDVDPAYSFGRPCTGAANDIPVPTYTNPLFGTLEPKFICYPGVNFIAGGLATNPPDVIPCAAAMGGSLGSMQALGTAVQSVIWNPNWNFDNWLRGDPQFQVGQSPTAYGPALSQALNIAAFGLNREKALCPAALPPGFPNNIVARLTPPVLTVRCDTIIPAGTPMPPNQTGIPSQTVSSGLQKAIDAVGTQDANPLGPDGLPTTIQGALNAFLDGVGTPGNTTLNPVNLISGFGNIDAPYNANGKPANISSVFAAIEKGLSETIPQAVGNDDPSQVGVTLAGSVAAVRDGLNGAVTKLGPALTGTPLLTAAVAGNMQNADLNAALSRAGLARAEKYKAFQGVAKIDGREAKASVQFVYETPGTTEGGRQL